SAAPLRVRTERRQRPFVAGIVAAVVGLALLVAGGVLMNVAAGSVVLDGKRAPFGTPIEFDAEDTSYRLVLVRYGVADTILEREVAATDCVATFADGSTATVDGARQGVAESTSTGLSIGSFDAIEGPATVVCTKTTGPGSPLARYALAEDR